jgi:hypothetical protein
MPRFALLLLAACSFDADYGHVHVTCTDDVCPSGLTCVDHVCTTPGDASMDSGGSDAHDAAPMHALTCADPGDAVGTILGTTVGHTSVLATTCGAAVYNGPETVYQIEGPGTVTLGIDGSGTYTPVAYVIGACSSFPTCEDNQAAMAAQPLTLSLSSGMHLVVVDGINPSESGGYTLAITR